MDETKLKARVETLLQQDSMREGVGSAYQGALSVAIALYGRESPQVEELQKASPSALDFSRSADTAGAVRGILKNAKEELESGFVGSLRGRISGEFLADFIALAREALGQGPPA